MTHPLPYIKRERTTGEHISLAEAYLEDAEEAANGQQERYFLAAAQTHALLAIATRLENIG